MDYFVEIFIKKIENIKQKISQNIFSKKCRIIQYLCKISDRYYNLEK